MVAPKLELLSPVEALDFSVQFYPERRLPHAMGATTLGLGALLGAITDPVLERVA